MSEQRFQAVQLPPAAFGKLCCKECLKELESAAAGGWEVLVLMPGQEGSLPAKQALALEAVSLVVWQGPRFLWERKRTSYRVPRISN